MKIERQIKIILTKDELIEAISSHIEKTTGNKIEIHDLKTIDNKGNQAEFNRMTWIGSEVIYEQRKPEATLETPEEPAEDDD